MAKDVFSPVPGKVNFPQLEEEITAFWKENKIFEKSITNRPEDQPYVFYDGPPFVTGIPHYGHLLGSIAKDLIPRFFTMKGKRVRRVWGWDCHGLPVENKVEAKLGFKNRRQILDFGVNNFIDACREYVEEVSSEWQWYVDKIGRWVDLEHAYRTMDTDFMESVIWVFKQLYDKNLIYEGNRVSLFCPRCSTPVSNFEIAMDDSYEMREDPAITVKFPLTDPAWEGAFVLAWTTTPWTLPSNRALVVAKKETYILVEEKSSRQRYVLAEKRLSAVMGEKKSRVLKKFSGAELAGLSYRPPYDFYPGHGKEFKIYTYPKMVNMEEGTGVVHSAPGFGEIDTAMGNHYGLEMAISVDDEGKFFKEVKPWAGVYVKEADPQIIADLVSRQLLFKEEKIRHRYPFCYRCRTPLIYKAQKSWFLKVSVLKDSLLATNQKVNWVPPHLKNGRFKKGIQTAPDWCLSRSRYWATVMPVWRCDHCNALKVVGSLKEIEDLSGQKPTGLHRNDVDGLTFKCEACGGVMHRVPEVLDCWLESGSMPYGERHYPFENKKDFESAFPADYIVEYIAQVRAWFYVLHVISNGLFNSHCFKNVVVTGTIAGTDGRKMSKSYGNYPDPRKVLTEFGGDALRLYLMGSRLMVGEDVNMAGNEELAEQIKSVLLPLWNSYRFFVTFANLNHFSPKAPVAPSHLLNRWIKARTQQLANEVDDALNHYQIPTAVRLLQPYLEDLSAWYIRQSREEFRVGDEEFLATLYEVLLSFAKIAAPTIPFVTEAVYRNLHLGEDSRNNSVHLADFPPVKPLNAAEKKLLVQMELAREVCSLAHSLRKEKDVKVRQPLARLSYTCSEALPEALVDLVAQEVNVKKIIWHQKKLVSPHVNLSFRLSDALVEEGKTRDLIRQIQQSRKDNGCRLEEKIIVFSPWFPENSDLLDQLKKKTLAKEILPGKVLKIQRL